MITSMIPNVENVFKNHHITNLTFLSVYNPYINYSWSQTLTVGGNQQIKDTGTAGLNLQQFFGQGVWFNGIDMQVTIPINATIQTEIKRVNGVAGINTNTQVLTNYNVYSGSGAKVYKDLYMFNRLLTQAEIEKYNNQPNQFFVDSLEDSSCILAMPICEKNNLVRNYKNNTDYPITNYLTTCRTNARKLPYGLQTSGFKRDSNGLILSKSSSLETDGVGYGDTGWIPENGQEFTIEWIYANPRNGVDVVIEGIGIEINNNADLYLRQIRTTGTMNVKFGANSIDILNVTFKMIYLAVTVTSGNFTVYVNSINRGTSSNTYNRTLNALNRTFFLGGVNRGSIEKIMTKESKLFKVHQKALSQEEVTQNFNKYQAQGLLNE